MSTEAIHEKIGQLRGDIDGLRALIASEAKRNRDLVQTGVIDRLVEHMDDDHSKFTEFEGRLRSVEDIHAHQKGALAASVKWVGFIATSVTVLINLGIAAFSKLAH